MKRPQTIEGRVVGANSLQADGRMIACWKNAIQASVAPQPLDLTAHEGKFVAVSGHLHSDLWEAQFERELQQKEFQRITGEVMKSNVIKGPGGPVTCFRQGMAEAVYLPLNLLEYLGKTITIEGRLHGDTLYRAHVVKVGEPAVPKGCSEEKEAKSLNDLLRIRAANREKIEAVNGNLGTALGFKWANARRMDHPCIIIFVPQKTVRSLVPKKEMAPDILKLSDGTWCLTDVVTGGKAASLGEFDPLPTLSEENRQIVRDLRSGRIGLVGGVQLAFFGDGIQDSDHAFVGTAGIPVRHRETERVGLLTNQHVADAPHRTIFHPVHFNFSIGTTFSTKEFADDKNWYDGVIDEERSFVRCDCGFVEVERNHADLVRSDLHGIGTPGPLLPIDPNTMNIIGQRVISVGRTRGVQRGTIVAYAYEFVDGAASVYTDLLIIGEENNAFSDKGDSGKIIVTDDADHRPVALLWGGWQERLRRGHEQENWTYAIDLRKVLERLNLRLLA